MKLVSWLKDFSKSIAKKREPADNKLEDFLKNSDSNFNLNFVFNNLRNYALAAGVLYVGIHIVKNGSFLFNVTSYSMIIGWSLFIAGETLVILNLAQFLAVTLYKKTHLYTKRKIKFLIILILNVLVIFLALEITWFHVNKLLGK